MGKVIVTSRSFGKIDNRAFLTLREAGHEVVMMGSDFNQEKFESEVLDCDAVILGANPFPEKILGKCKNLKVICKHGVGVDNIPLEKAKECGVRVCNTPGTNSNAVADLTFGLILACARHIVEADQKVRKGEWKPIIGTDVYGKTLGLIGFGNIAKNVARRAKGFNMKVLAFVRNPETRVMEDEFKDFVTYCDLETALVNSDIVSMHLSASDETYQLIDSDAIALMKEGAYFINTARGQMVDERALYQALVRGHLAGAALDATAVEPIDPNNELLTLDNVIITPHMGMSSKEAIAAVSQICADCAVAVLKGELPNPDYIVV